MKLHLTVSQIEVLKRAMEEVLDVWDGSGAEEPADVADRFILKDIQKRLGGPHELYDFSITGKVFSEDGLQIGEIDGEGSLISGEPDIRENLLWQFRNPEYTNFPTVNDWASHVDVLKLIAEKVEEDWEKGETVLVIDGRRLVFSGGRVEESWEVITYDAMKALAEDSKRERVRNAKRALNRFYDAGVSLQDQFDSLLIDLFHLAERDGVNIVETLTRAQRVFKNEGGEFEFRVLDTRQMDTARDALSEELTSLEDSGERDYEEDELQEKKRRVQILLMKLER